jgi:hypothetical protein
MKTTLYLSLCAALASSSIMADELSDWNHTMLVALLTAPATAAPLTPRVRAIVQAAARQPVVSSSEAPVGGIAAGKCVETEYGDAQFYASHELLRGAGICAELPISQRSLIP